MLGPDNSARMRRVCDQLRKKPLEELREMRELSYRQRETAQRLLTEASTLYGCICDVIDDKQRDGEE